MRLFFVFVFGNRSPERNFQSLPNPRFRFPETLKIKVPGNNNNPMDVRINAHPCIFLTLENYVSLEE